LTHRIASAKKRPGRPATGLTPTAVIRLPKQAIELIDKRAREQKTTRSAILRQIILEAIDLKSKP
jgi:hypothetical protein